jgi:hypothetical protein
MTPRMISLLFDEVSCDFVEVVVVLVSVVEVVLNCMFCTGILRTKLVSVEKATHLKRTLGPTARTLHLAQGLRQKH